MRPRVAEIRENTVAHVFGDKAVEPGDHLGDGAMIGGDDLAQILGIKTSREFGRADKITEHYRELSAFGIGLRQCFARYRRLADDGSLRAERSDSVEQPPTMADRHHADLPEILGRQGGQHPFVNLVCAERRLVLLKPETAEPGRYVHARLHEAVTAVAYGSPKCCRSRILRATCRCSRLSHQAPVAVVIGLLVGERAARVRAAERTQTALAEEVARGTNTRDQR